MNRVNGLYFEDGSFFEAKSGFGNTHAQVVAISGNDFIGASTDGSLKDYILVFSFPEAGFAPLILKEIESSSCAVKGVVFQKIANSKSGSALRSFYKERGIPLLEGVDTRALTLFLNNQMFKAEIYTEDQSLNINKGNRGYLIPNSGPRLLVIGNVPRRLIRYLIELGYELFLWDEEETPTSLEQIEGVCSVGEIKSESIFQYLLNIDLPKFFFGDSAQQIAMMFGGKTINKPIFRENYPVIDLVFDKRIRLVNLKLTKCLASVPGTVLYEELGTKRPLGYQSNNILGLEFFPDKDLLREILRRRGL